MSLKFFGRGKAAKDDRTTKAGPVGSDNIAMERALRFARQPRPNYSHSKKEAVQTALISLERAVLSIDGTQRALSETLSLLQTAQETDGPIDEAKLSVVNAQLNTMLKNIESYISAANVDDLNLVDGSGAHIVIALSEKTTGQLIIRRANLTIQGMGLIVLEDGIQNQNALDAAVTQLERALSYVTVQNETFCANATILAEHYGRL